jgi:hypothetical protein
LTIVLDAYRGATTAETWRTESSAALDVASSSRLRNDSRLRVNDQYQTVPEPYSFNMHLKLSHTECMRYEDTILHLNMLISISKRLASQMQHGLSATDG